MQKGLFFLAGMITGVVLVLVGIQLLYPLYIKGLNNTLWSSSDPEKVKTATSALLNDGLGLSVVEAFFCQNLDTGELPPNPKKRIVVLDYLDETYMLYSFPMMLSYASVSDEYGRDVRYAATRYYDKLLNASSGSMLAMMALHLSREDDPELLDYKLDFLCRRTYLNRQMVDEKIQQEGIDVVHKIICERIAESHIQNSPYYTPEKVSENHIEYHPIY